MADEEDALPPPLEIPWKLASTTQPLASKPAETAISLFYFEPDDDELRAEFPDERLVYLKVTCTISPATPPPNFPPIAGAALGEGAPCFHALLDLAVRRGSGEFGTTRPYFHAAAPLRRRMIQSGVVGGEVFEGEAEGQFMGKSGSQMYESSSTSARTTSLSASAGGGIGPFSASASVRRTSTDVSSERSATQVVDTTTREASEERRELVSHHTRVENLLTLLNAKYVGTPHLSFSLSPRPLQTLSADPSDPSLWFGQLLQRRSSGIEGVQEFTAVVVVPRDEDFCVNARLRRVCVFAPPLPPLTFDERFQIGNPVHVDRLFDYLERVYPPGTPLEEFDLDLISALPTPELFTRPVLESWVIGGGIIMIVDVLSPTPGIPQVKRASVNYKTMIEIWLETLRDEYEREAARSPLERGVLLGENRSLDTCFRFEDEDEIVVSGSSATVGPLFPVPFRHPDFSIGGVSSSASAARAPVRARALEAAARWNLLEERLSTLLAHRRDFRETRVGLNDARVRDLLVESWAALAPDDPRNLGFEEAAGQLSLNDEQRRRLKAAGATDLRTIAQALRAAPAVARRNEAIRRLRRLRTDEAERRPPPELIGRALAPDAAAEILRALGDALEQAAREAEEEE